jgi:hypothetical protein
MAEPLRHRQTKEAATDMFGLKPPRHISTLPFATDADAPALRPLLGHCGHSLTHGRLRAKRWSQDLTPPRAAACR